MRTATKLMAIFLLLINIQSVHAQAQNISGTITDSTAGTPLSGVTIKVKGAKTATVSSANGSFSINAKTGDVLELTYVGYQPVNITVIDASTLNIVMQSAFTELSQLVVVGSRSGGRVNTETPVPVDIVNTNQAVMPTARMDITSVLNYAAPSFNYNKQSGSDGADHVDLATLRGLSPDQTLVLINGKRRHQTAFVAVFGTRGRGSSGTDLNAIPEGSIDHVEILRDGASAQYGSDAIAGVINLVLKKDVSKFSMNVGYSGYYDHKYNTWFDRESGQYPTHGAIDGNAFSANANYGFSLGKNGGYLNLTGSFNSTGKTFRQILDTADFMNNKDALYYNYVRRGNGDASLTEVGGMLNMMIPFGKSNTSFYAFGGINQKWSDAYAFSRSWNSRPERFPTDGNGSLSYVPSIMYSVNNGDGSFDTVYNPHIQTHVQDLSLSAGIKGDLGKEWAWDFSNTIGRNNFHYFGDKTFNASLGSGQQHFNDGGFNFLQNTINADFSKKFASVAEGLNLALGAEYRYERYSIYQGEEASWQLYDINKAAGSQGYPGYRPGDEVKANRNVVGVYADAELDATEEWLLGGAVRFENYNDFGSTVNFKFDTRYKVAHNFNLRGSVSTGFRAPSLAQINFSNTFTTVQGGNILEVKIAPNYSPITQAAGIPNLKQEKSFNASFGFAWKASPALTVTVDGYLVKIKDRVVLSGQFSSDDPDLDPNLTSTLQDLNVAFAQFFANAVNTTNAGVDIVFDFKKKFDRQHFNALLTGNIQSMTIDKINVPERLSGTESLRKTFFSDREQKFLLASAPKQKFALTLEYGINNFSIGARLTYFGKVTLLGYGEDGSGINPMVPTDADENVYVPDRYNYGGKFVPDVYLNYKISKNISIFVGADNIANIHPDYGLVQKAKYWAFNNEPGGPWDPVQMGQNGIHLFAKAAFNF